MPKKWLVSQHCILIIPEMGQSHIKEMRLLPKGVGAGYGKSEICSAPDMVAKADCYHVDDVLGQDVGREMQRFWDLMVALCRFAVF
jgi:hypothetical protein